jgi:GNAT superfamily N-acetyltransferase
LDVFLIALYGCILKKRGLELMAEARMVDKLTVIDTDPNGILARNLLIKDGKMNEWLRRKAPLAMYLCHNQLDYIGALVLMPNLDDEFNCDIGIFVHKNHRKKGVGWRLLDHALKNHGHRKTFTGWTGEADGKIFYGKYLEKNPGAILTTDKFTPRA